jgi:hypothetical protein
VVREGVVAGNRAQVPLDAARDAQLLVVGSHGYAGFKAALARLGKPTLRSTQSLPGRHRPGCQCHRSAGE